MPDRAKIFLRFAVAEDEPVLKQVIEDAYAGYGEQGIDLPPVAEGLDTDIRDRIVWVAVDSETILGGLVLALHKDFAHVLNVAVDPAVAGRGVGRKLMDKAETYTRDAGRFEMRLATHRDLGGNVLLYQHLGWRVAGTEGVRILMVKSLGRTKG